jgi:hypothetical protein
VRCATPAQHRDNPVLANVETDMHQQRRAAGQAFAQIHTIDINGPISFTLHGDDLLYVDAVVITDHHSTIEASPLSSPVYSQLGCVVQPLRGKEPSLGTTPAKYADLGEKVAHQSDHKWPFKDTSNDLEQNPGRLHAPLAVVISQWPLSTS